MVEIDRLAVLAATIFLKESRGGFVGGLSAENYLSITKTSRATTTRDLQNLVEIKALKKTEEGRWTSYFLNLQTS